MSTLPSRLRRHVAGLRALLVLTVVCGVAYPAAVLAVAQLPGLRHKAGGSYVTVSGREVGSSLIGQSFTDREGRPLRQYFQSRISNAGDGYDPTATGASNLGPEDVVDGRAESLLTRVCAASLAVGRLESVDGSRPFCTPDGRGAVLAVFGTRDRTGDVAHPVRVVSVNQACPAKPFLAVYRGLRVECGRPGADYSAGRIVPIRGTAPAHPVVPPDAVTGSGSGLDPHISVAWARLQAARVARARGLPVARVLHLIDVRTTGRALGFLGEPSVNVLELNIALDRG
ncbi:Potassium-transporting ATPase C chain [Actinomadura rubteroloni]|uniref:Potassium-transporting ATPase KdpC subunit n=1 Tax=Actinomadura rubteroloni TaxID=1926885 RepID=A0A2P4UFI2_9ACTN|nr:potassium-transporting ATPase subunit C [Actinomadura rubteroloni]POM23814.1 Potassium-transporting ATPase C chain [Actinomadura rubteroloni]